jgi:hypothetical protein
VREGTCKKKKPFRYEVAWERVPSLPAAVEEAWSRRVASQDLGDINGSLQEVMNSLYKWKVDNFTSLPKVIEKKRDRLEELVQCSDDENGSERQKLMTEMEELLYREEIAWLQRSRVAWLQAGDRNTKYFHRRATWRRKKNRVCKLKRPDGSWTMDAHEMEELTLDYFKKLYTSEDDIDPRIITDLLQPCVDADANERLCAPFTEKEISDALFKIGPLKAPGPDGFPAHFIQRNWGLLKEDVVRAVQRFFTDGAMPDDVNDTSIVLIPKKSDPEDLKDFRPISLCDDCVLCYTTSSPRHRVLLFRVASSQTMHLWLSSVFMLFRMAQIRKRNFVRISWIWLRLMIASIGVSWKGF